MFSLPNAPFDFQYLTEIVLSCYLFYVWKNLRAFVECRITEKTWLQGPMEFDEVCKLLGDQWLPVRRFCVEQKGKLRPIDDFCENRLNQAFSSVDKISLKTMDHITWAALVICKHSLHNHEMDFVLKSGERLHGTVILTGLEDALSMPLRLICGVRTNNCRCMRRM